MLAHGSEAHSPAIVTLAAAKAAGLKRYFTGKPCKYGHVSERSVVGRACRGCESPYRLANRDKLRQHQAKWRTENRELARRRVRDFLAANPDKDRAYGAKYRARHPEKVRARSQAFHAKNSEAERASRREWSKRNLDRLAAKAARRRAQKFQATPEWADLGAIAAVYSEARRLSLVTGIEHHVDHIVPLNSKIVCGLHCEANLQILPGKENLSKGNRSWPNMP